MLKEIFEQPRYAMQAINNGGRLESNITVKLGGLDNHKILLMTLDNIIILGCGTSYNAGLWAIKLFKSLEIFNTVTIYDGAEFEESDIPKNGRTGFIA